MFKKIRRPFPLFIVIGFLVLYVIESVGVYDKTPVLFINNTASEPLGLYMAVPYIKLKYGDKVIIRPPEKLAAYLCERGWIRPGQTLIKTIYGLPGDTYTIDDQAIYINGQYQGPIIAYDSEGLPLPKLRGTFVVQDRNALPLALFAPNSFDGRYFGEVPQTSIVRKVVPLYTY